MSGRVVYVNGRYLDEHEAVVSVFDHGFLYGDGVFDALRVVGGTPFKLDRHLARFERSAAAIALEMPLTRQALETAVMETARRNDAPDCYIRLVLTRGTGFPLLDPRSCEAPTLVIFAEKDTRGVRPSADGSAGLKLITSSFRRPPPDYLDARVKTICYLNNVMARLQAINAGADEALQLDSAGNVAEATAENLFIVRDGRLSTPVLGEILEGITRETVIEVAAELGIPSIERNLTLYDIYVADEAFLTGTAGGVLPVAEVDGRTIRHCPGPVTIALSEGYDARPRAAAGGVR